MGNLHRIKKRMVRDAIAENILTLRNRRPDRRRDRGRRVALTVARVGFLLGLPAALFGSSYLLSNVADGWVARADLASASRLVRGLAASRLASREERPLDPSLTFAAPKPIDSSVLPLALHKVVLDPGHGGPNRGTAAPQGVPEKELTLDIAVRLRRLLERDGFQVVMTREDDQALSLKERAEIANEARGDIFLSIHVNWISNRRVRGVETYYLGPTDDPYLTELAAQENRDSGYSLADFRDLLERVYADVRQEESRELAEAVQRGLHDSLRKINRGVENRGVKTAPFGVLTRTEMPAILAEVSCLSNDLEASLLVRPSYRQFLAEALFRGVQSYAQGLTRNQTIGS